MKRVLGACGAVLPLLAVLALLAPPPSHATHSHTAHGHVPTAESDPCAGGGVHLHAARTLGQDHCPACAAGPTPAAVPPASTGVTVPERHAAEPGNSQTSFLAPPGAPRRSRAPPNAVF